MEFHLGYALLLIAVLNQSPYTDGWMFKKLKFKWSLTRYCPKLSATFSNASPFTKQPVPECFVPKFYLHSRAHQEPVEISTANIPEDMAVTRRTVFIVHGFRDKYYSPWVKDMTEALLNQADMNVIVTDWRNGAFKELWQYPQVSANARTCGKAIHDLLKKLMRSGLKRRKSHCIGHSLGAHVCGYAGKYKPFGRISGLDPAGPNFESLPAFARLNSTDADFVDVIHTDGGTDVFKDYGTLVPMGNLDFYPNGGKKQPGCFVNKRKKRATDDTVDMLEQWVICSHLSAVNLYTDSIRSKHCVATAKCESASSQQLEKCSSCSPDCPLMGYHSVHNRYNYSGLYDIITAASDHC